MTEIEAKSPEEVHEDAEKENIEPAATTDDAKESALSADPETKVDSKNDDKADATDPPPLDLSIYTENKLYDDIQELIRSEALDPTTASKKVFRRALSEKYGLGPKGKMFKKHEPFHSAINRIAADFTAKQEEDAEDAESAESEKKKSKNKKSRKRKRPSSEDEEADADGAPTKKRKANDGGAMVDAESEGDGVDGGDDKGDGDGSDDDNSSKKKSKKKEPTKRKKKSKQPYENSLQRLKKLARAVGLTNPRMYRKLKAMSSNKKQVDFLRELLAEHDVPTNNLSESAIKKIQEEYALKREMAELGIVAGSGAAEDGVPLSCRRPKRTRSKVNYKPPKYEKGSDSDGEEEYVDEEEEESEEEEEYMPSDCDED